MTRTFGIPDESDSETLPAMEQGPSPPQFNVGDLMGILQQIQTQIVDQSALIRQQQVQLEATQRELRDLQMTPTPTPVLLPAPQVSQDPLPAPVIFSGSESSSGIKFKPPEPYSGRREHTRRFLEHCELAFRAFPNWTPSQQVVFACSYLQDSAFNWRITYEKNHGKIPNFATFEKELVFAFGETDVTKKAKTTLSRLRQTKSCSIYTTEFNRLVSDIGYTDQVALIDMYRKGLKENVKDLLVTFATPTTLRDAQKDAIDCDERLFDRLQEGKRSDRTPRLFERDSAVPMEIDSISNRGNRLSNAEKDRRRRENLCIYDGKADCPGRDNLELCPNLLKKKPPAGRITQKR